jgi:hypothetical protein
MDVCRENADVRWVGFHPLQNSSYLATSCGQIFNFYLNVANIFNTRVDWTVVFLHRCIISAVLFVLSAVH